MKDAWCLAASDPAATAPRLKALHGKPFSIEEMFHDVKDWRFGMGQAGERVGLDRLLETNTAKNRTLSLFRQGLLWYERVPMMPEDRLRILVDEFSSLLREHPVHALILGVT